MENKRLKKVVDFVKQELKKRIKEMIADNKDLPTICKELKFNDYEVIGLIELMKQDGELVDYVNGEIVKLKKPIQASRVYKIPNDAQELNLLLISDTHLASKFDRLDILNHLYEEAKQRGVHIVLHSGDLTDGRSNRAEQVYELKEPSYEGQVDYVIKNYPKVKGITTYVIGGNHDQFWYKFCGSDIVQAITNERKDMVYLGADVGDLKIGNLSVRLYHGKGNQAYSRSYRIQKYLDAMPIDEKPDILQTGHIHQAFYFKQDFTHCFQTGCLEDQTPFARSLGLSNEKSCWWVNVKFDNKGNILSITPELEEFDKKKETSKTLIKRK